MSFMQGIYTYIPDTNHVPREYSVSAILSLIFMLPMSLVPALLLLYSYFYVSTFRSMCAVPNMAVIIIIIIIIIIVIVFVVVVLCGLLVRIYALKGLKSSNKKGDILYFSYKGLNILFVPFSRKLFLTYNLLDNALPLSFNNLHTGLFVQNLSCRYRQDFNENSNKIRQVNIEYGTACYGYLIPSRDCSHYCLPVQCCINCSGQVTLHGANIRR